VIVLLPFSFLLFWRTRAFWPQLGGPRYQELALFCGLLAIFGIFAMKTFAPPQLWYSALALTLFTLAFASVMLGGSDELPKWRRRMRYLTPVAGAAVLIVWIVRQHDVSRPLLVFAISTAAALLAVRLPMRRRRLSPRPAYLLAMGGLL